MRHRIWVGRPFFVTVAAVAFAASVGVSACYTGDQSCAEAYNQNDPNDHCPYGPPGGPKVDKDSPQACPLVPKVAAADCQVGFVEDVFPVLMAHEKGNCTGGDQGGCHTFSPKGIKPFQKAGKDDPNAMLDALSLYRGELTRKYYDPDDPSQSWWICNLRGDVGSLMPTDKPRMSSADIAPVERWLGRHAPLNRPGGGGTGGAGGGTTTTM